MSAPLIQLGKPAHIPQLNAWLNETRKGFELVLKHSDDNSDQRLFFFEFEDGRLVIKQQKLAAISLCAAFGTDKSTHVPIIDWHTGTTLSHRQQGEG